MSALDLTTSGAVKARLGLPETPTTSDATIAALVTAASRAIHAALSRPSLLPRAFSERLDLETDRVFLGHWPVLGVDSVVLDGLVLPPAEATSAEPVLGYLLQPGDVAPPGRPQALDIFGRLIRRRRQGLSVSYRAGYAVEGEGVVAPSAAPYLIAAAAPYGAWASDLGVIYAGSGLALQAVTGAPTVGQYSVADGLYRFSAADAGAGLALSYGYVPQDLRHAATELAADRFRAGDRIGLRSKSMGGQETISYDLAGMSEAVLALIAPYKRTAF